MRELERESLPLPTPLTAAPLAVIGRGRVGRSLARAAELAGIEARLGGGDEPTRACRGAGAALLCVPDTAIVETAPELLPVFDALAARAKAAVRASEGVSA